MKYNLKSILEFSQEVAEYEIYKVYGHGVMEAPFENGEVVETFHGSEIEAWIITQHRNIMLHGPMHKRSTWESPHYSYRKK